MSIAGKPFELQPNLFEQIKFISPNLYELRKIADTLKVSPDTRGTLTVEEVKTEDDRREVLREIAELCSKLQHIDNIVVSAGVLGVFIQRSHDSHSAFFTPDLAYIEGKAVKTLRHYPGQPLDNIVNASGAGDAFCVGFLTRIYLHFCWTSSCGNCSDVEAFCAEEVLRY
jgi:sugar/nucleoside kinase (ribokinase family)